MSGSAHHRMLTISLAFSLAACSSDLNSSLDPVATRASSRWSEWLPPQNAGTPVNSPNVEVNPFLSRNGLALYFGCNGCPGGFGGFDLWVSRRASLDDPWGTPENLGAEINTTANEASVSISVDGHRMFFTSARADGFGGNDIYMARRQ